LDYKIAGRGRACKRESKKEENEKEKRKREEKESRKVQKSICKRRKEKGERGIKELISANLARGKCYLFLGPK
jgi:hypothetical protein